ncbi:MAG: ATP-binding protein [Myxococcales bacterium]|jgi:signal transduction histidine kinase
MRLRPWHTFAAFGACLALVAGAVAGISATVLDLARSEARARHQADVEERVRLALWRMDSAAAPIVARESARPPQAFEPPAGQASQLGEHVLLLFELDADGVLTAPRRAGAEGGAHRQRIARLAERRQLDALEKQLAKSARKVQLALAEPVEAGAWDERGAHKGAQRGKLELQRRTASVQQIALSNAYQALSIRQEERPRPWAMAAPDESVMVPVWIGDDLLLARRVHVDGVVRIQGSLLDWEGIRRWLLGEVRDLLPDAELAPLVDGADSTDASRQLASLPALLRPGVVARPARARATVRLVLGVAWSGVLLAILAVGALLVGTLSLSERRAAFVSAVTHELRTPLTTFRMYTEMLAEGMVADEGKRQRYLETLHGEARRLSHLVENVLAFARIERGRHGAKIEALAAGEVIERARQHLEERAAQAGMSMVVDVGDAQRGLLVSADAAAVEQILFNLVDNACKYAAKGGEPRIELSVEKAGARVTIRVQDRGPGIAADVRRRLFSPFSRSAEKAAGSAPGVGLGLALSRRLARAMKGDLRYEPRPGGGASFVLILRAAKSSERLKK